MASEAVPAAAAMAAGSGRRPARGQHRKAPSDTFAWAAAQVLTQLPPTANGLSAVPDTFPRGGATLSAPLLPGLAKPPGELVAAHAGSLPGLPNQLVDILQGVTEDELGEQELLPDATEDMDQLDDGLGASGSQQSSEDGEELEGRGRSARRTSSGGRDSSGAPGGGTRRRAASSAGGRGRHTRTPSDSTVGALPLLAGPAATPTASTLAALADKPLSKFVGQTRANALDPAQLDPKRAKRIIANRQSAHRSRMKKLQAIHELENQVTAAQAATEATRQQVTAAAARRREALGAAAAAQRRLADLRAEAAAASAMAAAVAAELRAMGITPAVAAPVQPAADGGVVATVAAEQEAKPAADPQPTPVSAKAAASPKSQSAMPPPSQPVPPPQQQQQPSAAPSASRSASATATATSLPAGPRSRSASGSMSASFDGPAASPSPATTTAAAAPPMPSAAAAPSAPPQPQLHHASSGGSSAITNAAAAAAGVSVSVDRTASATSSQPSAPHTAAPHMGATMTMGMSMTAMPAMAGLGVGYAFGMHGVPVMLAGAADPMALATGHGGLVPSVAAMQPGFNSQMMRPAMDAHSPFLQQFGMQPTGMGANAMAPQMQPQAAAYMQQHQQQPYYVQLAQQHHPQQLMQPGPMYMAQAQQLGSGVMLAPMAPFAGSYAPAMSSRDGYGMSMGMGMMAGGMAPAGLAMSGPASAASGSGGYMASAMAPAMAPGGGGGYAAPMALDGMDTLGLHAMLNGGDDGADDMDVAQLLAPMLAGDDDDGHGGAGGYGFGDGEGDSDVLLMGGEGGQGEGSLLVGDA